jgi:hypothetical protein
MGIIFMGSEKKASDAKAAFSGFIRANAPRSSMGTRKPQYALILWFWMLPIIYLQAAPLKLVRFSASGGSLGLCWRLATFP